METQTSIYSTVYNASLKYKNKTALIFRKKHIKYKELINKINIVSHKLKTLGFKKDDVITIVLPNIPFTVYILYAINQIGAIANLIHPLMKREQLKEIINTNESKIIFCLDINYDEFSPLIKEGIQVIPCNPLEGFNSFVKNAYSYKFHNKLKNIHKKTIKSCDFLKGPKLIEADNSFLKDSFYLHSGGSTGKSKTIALSNYSINALCSNGGWIMSGRKDLSGTYILSVLPIFHGFGLAMGIHIELMWGGTDVLMPKFSTDETIDYIEKKKLTYLIGVPVLYEALLRNPRFCGKKLKNLDCAFVGGDFVSETLIKNFNTRMDEGGSICRLFEGYGLTETVTVCSVNTHKHHLAGTVGKVLPNCKCKIMSLDGRTNLGYNQEGEIYIGGETLMNSYRFSNDIENPFVHDKQGEKWVRTGDYGSLNNRNYITFKQRLKRIVKVNGVNCFPSDIENACKELDIVFDCVAKGVEDKAHGQIIKLFVVLDRKFQNNNYDKELKEKITNKCGVYAVPKEIVYLDHFEKTIVGKVDVMNLK